MVKCTKRQKKPAFFKNLLFKRYSQSAPAVVLGFFYYFKAVLLKAIHDVRAPFGYNARCKQDGLLAHKGRDVGSHADDDIGDDVRADYVISACDIRHLTK